MARAAAAGLVDRGSDGLDGGAQWFGCDVERRGNGLAKEAAWNCVTRSPSRARLAADQVGLVDRCHEVGPGARLGGLQRPLLALVVDHDGRQRVGVEIATAGAG